MMKERLIGAMLLLFLAGSCGWFRREPMDPGVPIYPGARNANSDRFSARLRPQDQARLVRVFIYETTDPASKVIEFYKQKLSSKTQVFEKTSRGTPSAVFRTDVSGKLKFLMITANEDTEKTEILIGDITEERK